MWHLIGIWWMVLLIMLVLVVLCIVGCWRMCSGRGGCCGRRMRH